MGLWWLQPGWDQACCACCGNRIAPEGDPDWGLCFPCMEQEQNRQHEQEQMAAEQRAYEEQYYREHPHG